MFQPPYRQGLLVEPDHLAVLKLQLEAKLKEMDNAAKVVRRQLEEIAEAERIIRQRDADQ